MGLADIYRQIRTAIDTHDGDQEPEAPYRRCRKKMKAKGVMMAHADMERIGLDDGETVYPSKEIKVFSGGQYGNLRILCPCQEDVWNNVEDIDARHDLDLGKEHSEDNLFNTDRQLSPEKELVPA
jgi:hypothetical protein